MIVMTPIDPAARPLIASGGPAADAALLGDSEGVLSRAKAALEELEATHQPQAPAMRQLAQLFGASIRRAYDLKEDPRCVE